MSGIGDDANPCSRTAPCKTFAGSISKTADNGEINCLDPGGFGAVTITKSLTIACEDTRGGVLVSGTNAIIVNAAADDRVVLRGLDIQGTGTGLNAIRVLQAARVDVAEVSINNFARNAIDAEPTGGALQMLVENVKVTNNGGNGVLAAPSTGVTAKVIVRNSSISNNACGITATSHGPDPAFNYATNCGTLTAGDAGAATIDVFDTTISDSDGTEGAGLFSNGPNAVLRFGDSEVINNHFGLRALDAGSAGGIFSYGNNVVSGNTENGTATGVIARDTPSGPPGPAGAVGRTGPAGPAGPAGANGVLTVVAFSAKVSRRSVKVRYALTGGASLALKVGTRTVARKTGKAGLGTISWNRRLGSRKAKRGRYTLRLVATLNGKSTSSRIRVMLR